MTWQIENYRRDGVIGVVALRGDFVDVDVNSDAYQGLKIVADMVQDMRGVVLDLTDVTSVDVSGSAALDQLKEWLEGFAGTDCKLVLASVSASIQEVLSTAGSKLQIWATVADAEGASTTIWAPEARESGCLSGLVELDGGPGQALPIHVGLGEAVRARVRRADESRGRVGGPPERVDGESRGRASVWRSTGRVRRSEWTVRSRAAGSAPGIA
ncbi:STAS domain-containing protein [Nannocystis pusilla]|uniref:STAS domain-containing protein n=1 Tax=Nannocystis pusilla TaxID=889268 RepID=UPI003B7E72DC